MKNTSRCSHSISKKRNSSFNVPQTKNFNFTTINEDLSNGYARMFLPTCSNSLISNKIEDNQNITSKNSRHVNINKDINGPQSEYCLEESPNMENQITSLNSLNIFKM